LLELSSNDPLQRSWQRGSIWSSVNEQLVSAMIAQGNQSGFD
jgi:hypothetical protein